MASNAVKHLVKAETLKEPQKGNAKLIDVSSNDEQFKRIKSDFQKAGLKPLTVQRIGNHNLWKSYTSEKKDLLDDRGDQFNINEYYLYHGANGKRDANDELMRQSGPFGLGTYFSDDLQKCKEYAEKKGNQEKLIYLARVMLGDIKIYSPGEKDPDLKGAPTKKNPGRGNKYHDSVKGKLDGSREFVIYSGSRALIECVITFEVDKDSKGIDLQKRGHLTTNKTITIDMNPNGMALKKPDDLVMDDGCHIVSRLQENHPLFQGIKEDFKRAGFKPLVIKQVKNHKLWKKYNNEKTEEFEGVDPNECYLYHGTTVAEDIFLNDQIDNRLAKKGCFGKGTYFSDNPVKCNKYAGEGDKQKQKLMVLARVLRGEAKVYPPGERNASLCREPDKENPMAGGKLRYDSVQGSPHGYNEYVIYEKRRALIECLITYISEDASTSKPQASAETQGFSHTYDGSSSDSDSDYSDYTSSEDEDEPDTGNRKPKIAAIPQVPSPQDSDHSDDEDGHSDEEDDHFSDVPDNFGSDSEDEFHETSDITPTIDESELKKKIQDFKKKTNEKEYIIARLYLVLEGYDVDRAVKSYNTPIDIQLTPEEEAKAEKILQELEKEEILFSPRVADFDSLTDTEKDKIKPKFITQFSRICGLKDKDDVAKKHLTNSKWEVDMAVISYFEEIYKIR